MPAVTMGRYSNRMEFKGTIYVSNPRAAAVDIATEWNLKLTKEEQEQEDA